MPCASFSLLGSSSGTGCNEIRFPVHGGWDSRDVDVISVSKSELCNVIDHLVCWLGIVYNVCISHIVWWYLV